MLSLIFDRLHSVVHIHYDGKPCSETVNLRRNQMDEDVTLVRDWMLVTTLVYHFGTTITYLNSPPRYDDKIHMLDM